MRLKDRVAIITGASRGIGQAIAQKFATEGAIVINASRHIDETLVDQPLAIATDVAERQSVAKMVNAVINKYGQIDILVNNAGIIGPVGPIDQIDQELWWQAVKINLGGTFNCSQAVLPTMIKQAKGIIINFGGGGGTGLRRNFSAYAASKTAIIRLTENMGAELKKSNIRVNAIAPGAVNTQIQDDVLAQDIDIVGSEAIEEAKAIKSGQMGVPVTLPADLAVWLASDQSAPLTGKLISAPHDRWQTLTPEQLAQANQSEAFTLRRIKFDE